jgi:hypothetical protein
VSIAHTIERQSFIQVSKAPDKTIIPLFYEIRNINKKVSIKRYTPSLIQTLKRRFSKNACRKAPENGAFFCKLIMSLIFF